MNYESLYRLTKQLKEVGIDREDQLKVLSFTRWNPKYIEMWIKLYKRTKMFSYASLYILKQQQSIILVQKWGEDICVGRIKECCEHMGWSYDAFIIRKYPWKYNGYFIKKPKITKNYKNNMVF